MFHITFWPSLIAGALYLIQRETQATLLGALFRVFILMISATPYDLDTLVLLFSLLDVV